MAAAASTTLHILGGSGSVGLLFATRLAHAGHRVTLLLRDESLAAFRALEVKQGNSEGAGALVTLSARAQCTGTSDADATTLRAAVRAEPTFSSSSSSLPPIDNLIVATKASAAAPALRALAAQRRLDRERTCALLLCNGVLAVRDEVLGLGAPGGKAAAAKAAAPATTPPLPLRRLLVASVGHGVYRPRGQPFYAVHAGLGECVIGDLEEERAGGGRGGGGGRRENEEAEEEEPLVRALRAAGPLLGARWQADAARLRRALLDKLATNCAANAAAALLRCHNGSMLAADNPAAGELQRRVLAEFAATFPPAGRGEEGGKAAAEAEAQEQKRLAAATTGLLTRTRGNVNSMLQDFLALKPGQRTEIDYLNGWVVEQARAKGVAAPANETLAWLVRAAEASAGDRVCDGG
jgi:2-dehydropantoate 2-reductase